MTHRRIRPLGRRWFGAALALSALTLASPPALALQPVTEFLAARQDVEPAEPRRPRNDGAARRRSGRLDRQPPTERLRHGDVHEEPVPGHDRGAPRSPRRPGIPHGSHPAAESVRRQRDAQRAAHQHRQLGPPGRRPVDARGRARRRGEQRVTVEKSVLHDYYTLLGDEAVLLSAVKNVEVAQHNVRLARDRKESGTGSELDVQRALADQAKAEQNVTAAQLDVTRRPARPLLALRARRRAGERLSRRTICTRRGPSRTGRGRRTDVPSVQSAEASRATAEEGGADGERLAPAYGLRPGGGEVHERHRLRRGPRRHLPVPGGRDVEARHDALRAEAGPGRRRRGRARQRGPRAPGRRGRCLPRLAADPRRHRLGALGARAGRGRAARRVPRAKTATRAASRPSSTSCRRARTPSPPTWRASRPTRTSLTPAWRSGWTQASSSTATPHDRAVQPEATR